MARVVWTRLARAHVREIYEYIVGQGAPEAAIGLVDGFFATANLLSGSPEMDAIVPEWGAPYRQMLHGRYRILYRYDIQRDRVRILGVIHGSRRLTSAWRNE